jgi:hypothetical protein
MFAVKLDFRYFAHPVMKDGSEKDRKSADPGVQRIVEGARMFDEYRARIIATLPTGLSDEEFKRQLFERTYDETLDQFLAR